MSRLLAVARSVESKLHASLSDAHWPHMAALLSVSSLPIMIVICLSQIPEGKNSVSRTIQKLVRSASSVRDENMIIPIRCWSCGKPIGHLWDEYKERTEKNPEAIRKTLD